MHEPSIEMWVEFYARQGWKLFPVHGVSPDKGCTCGDPDCRNPGKHPANASGFKEATDADFVLRSWFGECNRNIGLATGSKSGVFVLDVDGPDGERALRELQEEHGRLPATRTSFTGRGEHRFFRMPDGEKISNSTSKLGPKLDIRGDGGYVILPPSHHASGAQYRWRESRDEIAEAPAWLIAKIRSRPQDERPTEIRSPSTADDQTTARARDALTFIDPDRSYDDWVSVGMALRAMGCDFSLWDDWSSKGEKYVAKEMASKWRSFTGSGVAEGTLWRMAEAGGWSNSPAVEVDIDPTPTPKTSAVYLPDAGEVGHRLIPEDEPRLPFAASSVPGMIGETVSWILEGANKPQPEVTLLAVLAAVAAVGGRKYESTKYRTRLNLYMCSVAPSGSGKDAPRKALDELFREAGLHDRHMGDQEFISAIGLLTSIAQKPSQLMMIDELGAVLSGINSRGAPAHEAKVRTLLLKLFSSSGGRITSGTYADPKRKPIVIDKPALSIYGSTTERTYARALTTDMVESGDINRWVVLPSSVGMPKSNFDACPTPPPESLRSAWMALGAATAPPASESDLTTYDDPCDNVRAPIPVEWSDDALAALRAYQIEVDGNQRELSERGYGALWGRAYEQAMKIAMLFAVSRNPDAPQVSDEDFNVARMIVTTSVDYLVWTVHNNVIDDTPRARIEQKIRDAVTKAGPAGLGYTDMARLTKGVQTFIRDDAIDALQQQGHVVLYTVPTGKRPRRVLVAGRHAETFAAENGLTTD